MADEYAERDELARGSEGIDAHSVTTGEELREDVLYEWKRWTFKALQVGDCLIEAGAVFTLYSDGATTWTCELSSGDTGDEMTCFFFFKDSRGIQLFSSGRYHFNISDKDRKHRWNDNRGPNATYAQHFAAVDGNTIRCYC
jgi:hypothetical protein